MIVRRARHIFLIIVRSPFSFVLIFASRYGGGRASSFVCRRQLPVNHSLTLPLPARSPFLTPADSMLRHACLREHGERTEFGSDSMPRLRQCGLTCEDIARRTVKTGAADIARSREKKGVSHSRRWESSAKMKLNLLLPFCLLTSLSLSCISPSSSIASIHSTPGICSHFRNGARAPLPLSL